MNICFLENTFFKYNSNHLYSETLRGAETVLINLSTSLKKLGHKVTIFNNCPNNTVINGINWININHYFAKENFDLAISNNDIRLFNKIKSNKKILISHSLQSIEKFIRKSQLHSYLKHRPKILLLSEYHKQNRSKFLTLFGDLRINWAVDDIFIQTKIKNNNVKNKAIFTSREDRNLDMLINIWNMYIAPFKNDAELLITPTSNKHKFKNIIFRKKGNQKDLIKDLLSSKVFLIPGHKGELFCLAAEEAKELCLPVITLGIGSLSERVNHGVTGFIAKNEKEFAEFTLEIFNNKNIYDSIRSNLFKIRGQNNWDNVAFKFINALFN
jgi:glycosyltransferase involved in cell wall biosynthesis